MKKIIMSLIIIVSLVGCGFGTHRQLIDEMKDDLIESQDIVKYDEIFKYSDKDIIKGYIIKGTLSNGEEYIYILDGVKGIGKGTFDTGEYYCGPVYPEYADIYYRIDEGENCGHDISYFIGIIFDKVSSVTYKGKDLEIQSKEIELDGEKQALTFYLMDFPNGDEINIDDFTY